MPLAFIIALPVMYIVFGFIFMALGALLSPGRNARSNLV